VRHEQTDCATIYRCGVGDDAVVADGNPVRGRKRVFRENDMPLPLLLQSPNSTNSKCMSCLSSIRAMTCNGRAGPHFPNRAALDLVQHDDIRGHVRDPRRDAIDVALPSVPTCDGGSTEGHAS
jgi:hypothetical protein